MENTLSLRIDSVAGMELWKGLFSREGRMGFVELVEGSSVGDEHRTAPSKLPATVFFLILNCLLNVSPVKCCLYSLLGS